MAFSSKLIGRMTKTTASNTHTANAIRAQTNGGFSTRSTGATRPATNASNRTIASYKHSMIGRSRFKYAKALNAEQSEQARATREERRSGLREQTPEDTSRKLSDVKVNNRFSGQPTGGSANSSLRPVIKPTFWRPK